MHHDSSARGRITKASMPALRRLSDLPRLTVPVVAVALLLGGLAGSGWWSVGALAVLALTLAWLSYLAWPSLSALDRTLRTLVIVGIAASAWWRMPV